VQRAIATLLGRGDIVLDLEHLDVRLSTEQLLDPIDITDEAADHPHASDVADVGAQGLLVGRTTHLASLGQHTDRLFEA
jgi:hypothetical protein